MGALIEEDGDIVSRLTRRQRSEGDKERPVLMRWEGELNRIDREGGGGRELKADKLGLITCVADCDLLDTEKTNIREEENVD